MKNRIAYITDTHLEQQLTEKVLDGHTQMHYTTTEGLYTDHFTIILDDIVNRGISMLVFGGDIGALAAYPFFFQEIKKRKLQLHLVMGNHDDPVEIARHLPEGHKTLTTEISIEQDEYKIIIVDTSFNEVSTMQLKWITDELAVDKPVLLFIHHPVLPVETPLDTTGACLRGREQLAALLQDHPFPVTIVCGHYHMIDDHLERNVRQLTTLASSYQIYYVDKQMCFNSSQFGYRILNMDKSNIRTELIFFTELDKDPSGGTKLSS